MVKRIIPLACALVLAWWGGARAAPVVNVWDCTATRIFPRASTGLAADTLGRFTVALDGRADSVSVSDSVNVYGARYVVLLAVSTGSDSLAVPALQSLLPGSTTWTGAGGFNVPYSGQTIGPSGSSTRTISSVSAAVIGYYNEPTIGGSTPLPLVNSYFRWRLYGSNRRRYNSANQATLAPQGSITVWALVWR